MTPAQDFVGRWGQLVARWSRLRHADRPAARALLLQALDQGLAAVTSSPQLMEVNELGASETADLCHARVIRLSGEFDVAGYQADLQSRQRRGAGARDAVSHYVKSVRLRLTRPRLDFDPRWYAETYLEPGDPVDPFLHWLLVGRQQGHGTLPRPTPLVPTPALAETLAGRRPPRRITLFAACRTEGQVDASLIAYVRELARWGEVYLLVDELVAEGETLKLDGIATGVVVRPHAGGDLGSYALLARDVVGWDVLSVCDEVLLVSDRNFLVRPLDELLTTMQERPGSWWGLAATTGDPAVEHPLPLAQVKDELVSRPRWQETDFAAVDFSFVGLRRRVIEDHGFRDRLEGSSARASVLRDPHMEIGLSRYLWGAGHDVATWVPDLTRHLPQVGAEAFDLVARGLPVLARALLAQNPLRVPDLADWSQRLTTAYPGAPVEAIAADLERTAPDDQLQRSMQVVTDASGRVHDPEPLTKAEFEQADREAEKHDDWWAFVVCRFDHTIAGNVRAVLEEVLHDPQVKKVVLTTRKAVDLTGENLEILPLTSRAGQQRLMACKQVFVKHGPRGNLNLPLAEDLHNVINLWHGIPLKRFNLAGVDYRKIWDAVILENLGSRAVITSSRIDTLAMSSSFFPMPWSDLWPTGLPRNDFILRDLHRLPADLVAAERALREEVDGRRLVLFLPTFKNGQDDGYYRFSDTEVAWLGDWCARNNAVLGVREHMADRARTYTHMLAPTGALDLSIRRFPDVEVLYRVGEGLVTDYSSSIVDFLLTGKKVASFAYDYERYQHRERGLFYDLERVLPGAFCRDFEQLQVALEHWFDERSQAELEDYEWKRRVFFDHLDDGSSARVVQRVRQLYREELDPWGDAVDLEGDPS